MKESVDVYQLTDTLGQDAKPFFGSIEDLRKFAKDLWVNPKFKRYLSDFNEEEEFYSYLDDDGRLFLFLKHMGFRREVICTIPLSDFED